jgi:hypothetical protein
MAEIRSGTTAASRRESILDVLVNHVGYELAGPKRFVARSEENLGPSAHFEVVDGTGRALFEGAAARLPATTSAESSSGEPDRQAGAGAAGSAGRCHYAGDFTEFRAAGGDFQIRFEAGNRVATGRRFGVGRSVLWRLTKPLALDHLRSSRAVRANWSGEGDWTAPGVLDEDEHFHDVGGGWFDLGRGGGTSLRFGGRALLALAAACARHGRDPQLRAELRWGADWLRRLVIRFPASGRLVARAGEDGRLRLLGADPGAEPHWGLVAGHLCAKVSEELADTDLLRRGERFWEEYQEGLAGMSSPDAVAAMLLSDVGLHVATLQPRYLAAAERRAETLLSGFEQDGRETAGARDAAPSRSPGAPLAAVALAEFAASVPDHPLTPRAKEAVGRFMDSRVEAARADPFGLAPEPEGTAGLDLPMRRAEEAWQALAAHKVTGRTAYVELATNALNWILGLNPWDRCLLRGAAERGSRVLEAARPDAAGPQGLGALVAPGTGPARAHIGGAAAYLMALALV